MHKKESPSSRLIHFTGRLISFFSLVILMYNKFSQIQQVRPLNRLKIISSSTLLQCFDTLPQSIFHDKKNKPLIYFCSLMLGR